jgi:hypothetical protein
MIGAVPTIVASLSSDSARADAERQKRMDTRSERK